MSLRTLALILSLLLAPTIARAASVSGTVSDAEGSPIPGARVFLEAGIDGPIVEVASGEKGAFSFSDVQPGSVGVFAHKPGMAFGGLHLQLALDDVQALTLRLSAPDSVSGKVKNEDGKAVIGAQISRVGIDAPSKVSIPFAKLQSKGIGVPKSGKDGRFTITDLPKGGIVSLKVSAHDYAVEAVREVSVGEKQVRVPLERGVLITGKVVSRVNKTSVGDLTILFTKLNPQYTTVVTSTGLGEYAVRLKPGNYSYHALNRLYRLPSMIPLGISDEAPIMSLNLQVSGVGTIRGKVADATTEKPVAGAVLAIEVGGYPAALTRTGASGEFMFTAAAMENTIRIAPVDGYHPPSKNGYIFVVNEGETRNVPTFWLAPATLADGTP